MKERPIYAFEEVDEDLSQLPTAAQRALDLAGEKLSPEAWQSLAVADRMALVTAGAFSTSTPSWFVRSWGTRHPPRWRSSLGPIPTPTHRRPSC